MHVLATVERWGNEHTQLIHETCDEERAVGGRTSFDDEMLDAELTRQHVERGGEIDLLFLGDDVRDAVARQLSEVAVRHILAEQDDDVVAPDIAPREVNLARRIERDGEALRVGLRHMNRAAHA